MLLNIKHETRYDYDAPVDYALQKVRLCPLDSPLQSVGNWALRVEGGKIEVFDREVSRNALAAEERRLRAEAKLKRKEQAEGIVVAEKRLGSQAKDMARQEKAEIELVRQLVEQERRERERKE